MRRCITRIFAALLVALLVTASPMTLTANAAKKKTAQAGTVGIVNITSTSEALKNEVLVRYNLVPVQIRNAFEALGWRIEITSQDRLLAYRGSNATQYPWYYEIAGTTIVDLKLICLNDKAFYSYESISHEMGHFFDNCLTTIDGSVRAGRRPEFYVIFNEEKAFLGDEYVGSSSTEFFAECFKYYVENPGFLHQACPKAFAYIDNEVRKYQYYVGDTTNLALPAASTARVTADGRYLYNGLDFSPVFNASAYYNRYPDLQIAIGYDATKLFQHFIQYGIAEGRIGL